MKKNYLFIAAFFCTFNLFSRTIILNIENGGPYDGGLYSRNENVQVGDIIRCVNNLSSPIVTNNFGSPMTNCRLTGVGNGLYQEIPFLAPGQYVNYTITNTTMTEFYFVYDVYGTSMANPGTFRNNRLNLSYPLSTNDFVKKSFQVALNDATKILSISKYTDDLTDVHIFNLLGKEMYREENVHFDVKEIDFTSFSDGIYIVQLRSREKVIVEKIIKR